MKEKPPVEPIADLEKARAARVAVEDAELRDAILDITAEKKKRQAPPKSLDFPSDEEGKAD